MLGSSCWCHNSLKTAVVIPALNNKMTERVEGDVCAGADRRIVSLAGGLRNRVVVLNY